MQYKFSCKTTVDVLIDAESIEEAKTKFENDDYDDLDYGETYKVNRLEKIGIYDDCFNELEVYIANIFQ